LRLHEAGGEGAPAVAAVTASALALGHVVQVVSAQERNLLSTDLLLANNALLRRILVAVEGQEDAVANLVTMKDELLAGVTSAATAAAAASASVAAVIGGLPGMGSQETADGQGDDGRRRSARVSGGPSGSRVQKPASKKSNPLTKAQQKAIQQQLDEEVDGGAETETSELEA
jgi:hypothetical protein